MDASGNVYVTGESFGIGTGIDYATIKYDPTGTQIWEARYNGASNGFDFGQALTLDVAGNVYVTGRSFGSTTNFDYATIKYDSNGNQSCEARYSGPGDDFARARGSVWNGTDGCRRIRLARPQTAC